MVLCLDIGFWMALIATSSEANEYAVLTEGGDEVLTEDGTVIETEDAP